MVCKLHSDPAAVPKACGLYAIPCNRSTI